MTRRRLLYASAASLCLVRIALHLLLIRAPLSAGLSTWLRALLTTLRTSPLLIAPLAVSVILALVTLRLLIASTRGARVKFLSQRESAAVLLATGFMWSLPMILGPGVLLGDDWAPQLRAALLALDSFRSSQIPAWSFLYGNGISYTLQYPPLSTLLVAGLAFVTHLDLETSFKLISAAMHGLFFVGGYRLVRALGMDRLPAVVGVTVIALTQQYWAIGFIHGSVPSLIASSLMPVLMYAFVRTLQTGAPKYAILFGCITGCIALAQPVAALFGIYTIAFALLGILLLRPSLLMSRVWLLALAGAVAVCVAAYYVTSIILYRPFNQFQFSSLTTKFYFPPLSPMRWFWWSPRIGSPPGIGSDQSGYVGIAVAAANAIAVVVALKSRTLISYVYLGCLAWGATLVYGAPLGIFRVLPFGYLSKGTYRLWPFLALGLMLGFAIGTAWLLNTRRYALVSALILLGIAENAPFSLKPAFHTSDGSVRPILASIPQDIGTSTFLVSLTGERNEHVLENFYRETSLARRPDFYYLHHEEIGIVGKRYWQLFEIISRADPGADWRQVREELKWFRVTRLIVIGRSAADYAVLGPGRSEMIEDTPVAIVPIDVDTPMRRQPDVATIQVSASDLRPDGSVVLPISYHPFLHVQSDSGALVTRSARGYLSACCVGSSGTWLRVEARRAPWLKWLYALSVCCLIGAFFLLAIDRRRKRPAGGEASSRECPLNSRVPAGSLRA